MNKKEKHRRTRNNLVKYKLKLKESYNLKSDSRPYIPCYPVDNAGKYTDEEDRIVRYKQYWYKGNRKKFYKKYDNKRVRKYLGLFGKNNNYRKVRELRWEIN